MLYQIQTVGRNCETGEWLTDAEGITNTAFQLTEEPNTASMLGTTLP